MTGGDVPAPPSGPSVHAAWDGDPGAPPPTVSIVLPTHNAAAVIARTLACVDAQTFRDWELIVCDDSSTDGTAELAAAHLRASGAPRWRVLALRVRSAAASRNHGIRSARGEFVAFLDDDDLWAPEKLARCVAVLHEAPLDVVCHGEYWQDEAGSRTLHRYSELFDRRVPPLVSLMRNNPFSTSAVVARRPLLLEAGLFDEQLPSAEDYDLWIRLAMAPGVRIGFIDDPLGTYTLRSGSESSKVERRLRALLAIGRKYAEPLRRTGARGGLELWMYLAKTYFTSGIRYAQQGRVGMGAVLALRGLLMWPFRLDLLRQVLRERARRREVASV